MPLIPTLLLALASATAHAPEGISAPPASGTPAASSGSQNSNSAPKLAVGAKVYDPKGNEVGTIDAMSGENAVVSTGTEKVALPPSAFAQWPKGLVVAVTRDELNASAEKARADSAAALATALKPGAEVRSVGGTTVLGTIKTVDADAVVLTTPRGDVQLPRTAYVMTPAGIAITFTSDQFDEALKSAKPAQAQ